MTAADQALELAVRNIRDKEGFAVKLPEFVELLKAQPGFVKNRELKSIESG